MNPLRWLAVFLTAALMAACAPGADGLKQACANTDTLLKGGYQIATASMKAAKASGTAKQLLGCFQDFVGALDAGTKAKETTCTASSTNITADITSVALTGADVAGVVANWKTCSVAALAKIVVP